MSVKILNEKDHDEIVRLMKKQVPLYMIARELGVERHTLSKYISEHEELERARFDAEESFCDSVEYLFKEKITKEKDLHAAMWYADRKLRNRGYGEHIDTDVNATIGGRVVIKIGRIDDSELPITQNKESENVTGVA